MTDSPSNVSTPCGVDNNGTIINCEDSLECFAAPTSPVCSNTSITSNAIYNWKINPNVFPPIQYIGDKIGSKQKDRCDLFTYNLWSYNNISWLLTFFYQNLDYNHNTALPPGSFVRPLDYIGSCTEKLFCGETSGVCRKKMTTDSQNSTCTSSNQCLSQLCGNQDRNLADANVTMPGLSCVDDSTVYYQLKGPRSFNVISNATGTPSDDSSSSSSDDSNGRDSSGSMVVVVIIVVILFVSMALYGYARRMFKKRDRENDESRFLRREIDPETGEVITISGRVRRGASILLNGGSLNRSNSIRTLPPYSVVDEGQPSNSTSSNGIVNSITQFFFPPGELPPPYDLAIENSDDYNSTMREITREVTLDEVRNGVTIEVLNNNNNNNNDVNINDNVNNNDNNNNDNSNNNNNDNNNNSTSSSRRSSTSSRKDIVDGSGELKELNTISEISPDSSDPTLDKEDKEEEEKEDKGEEEEEEKEDKGEEEEEEKGEKEEKEEESKEEKEEKEVEEEESKEVEDVEAKEKEMEQKEPTTEESITEESKEPTTKESITEESITEESITKEPTTEESVTKESITKSITEGSITKEPTTTTKESTMEESSTKESATEESITKESTTEESSTKESATKESITKESSTKELTTEESITNEPTTTTKESTTEESATEESITKGSTTKELIIKEPNTEESITKEPTTTTEESITKEPTTTTKELITESTSSKSTTINDPT